MIIPYIIMQEKHYLFKVLLRREDGFAPKSQACSIFFDVKPTFLAEETFENAIDRSETCDHFLRHLANLFLQDVFVLAHS